VRFGDEHGSTAHRLACQQDLATIRGTSCHFLWHELSTILSTYTWAPIVSVSLDLPAVFVWGGKRRSDPVRRLRLESGDIAVWGGPARFVYHGVAPLKDGKHPLTGAARINLTFRKVF
jgi:alkylated DNA repair dioxygenase AlkB